jgi:hypothetical protein
MEVFIILNLNLSFRGAIATRNLINLQDARLFKSFSIVRFLPAVEMTEKSK